MNPINLVFIANWDNITQLETCLKSVTYYNSNVNCYIFNSNIAQEWFFQLNRLLKPCGSHVIDKKTPKDQLADKFPVALKVGMNSELAHLDRALFLSTSTIIKDKLTTLYNYQLGTKLWAATDDQQVALINLQGIREQPEFQKSIDTVDLTNDQLTSLGCELPATFVSHVSSGNQIPQTVIQTFDCPWNNDLNPQNQAWWQFFATDWPVIQQRELLTPTEKLITAPEQDRDNTSKERMQFIMAANYAYQSAFLTTIKSLLHHNQNIDIHLINPDIPQTWFAAINQQIKPNRIIDEKISPDKLNIKDVKTTSAKEVRHVNNLTNALLYLHEIVKCHRAIYLDSDIIVNRNLRPLYEMDLKGHPFAASRELFTIPQINVGVMLLDLDRLRKIPQLTNRMIDYYCHNNVLTASESVISHFFFNEFLELDFTYNFEIGLERAFSQAFDFNKLDRSLNECYTIHYMSGDKPWKMSSLVRHRQLWWAYFDLSWHNIYHHPLPMQTRFTSPYCVMICTGDKHIEHFEKIVQASPEIEFYVTAHTDMAWDLSKMIQYPNVHIYPVTLGPIHQRLDKRSSMILDIGYGNKDDGLLESALEDGKFVMSFTATQASNKWRSYPNYLIFDDNQVQEFLDTLHRLVVYGDLSN